MGGSGLNYLIFCGKLEQRWEPESNLLWGVRSAKVVQCGIRRLETGLFESKHCAVLTVSRSRMAFLRPVG